MRGKRIGGRHTSAVACDTRHTDRQSPSRHDGLASHALDNRWDYWGRKTQETRVRRLATKYGYRLRKARWGVGASKAGAYMLCLIRSNGCVLGARYEVTLDDIERWLRGKDAVERPPPRLGIGSY